MIGLAQYGVRVACSSACVGVLDEQPRRQQPVVVALSGHDAACPREGRLPQVQMVPLRSRKFRREPGQIQLRELGELGQARLVQASGVEPAGMQGIRRVTTSSGKPSCTSARCAWLSSLFSSS